MKVISLFQTPFEKGVLAHLVEKKENQKSMSAILKTEGVIPLRDYARTLEGVYSEKTHLERLYVHERKLTSTHKA